ncbi:MAG: UDP-N-acetylmuramoyl-L-alanyl-D-glutamate--2,6-diaminopimelate ligase, partial [Planctomycetota bacterium]|nr:UDP-N-acetylmuramoyl-L-alanyl-D-glutamate--2,6-diaminopimelate ligase [Planctomycetota bacterium]
KADGHDFIPQAVQKGASAVLSERRSALFPDLTQIVISDAKTATAVAAATFFGHPTNRLKVVGITGTNGKTTTSMLVHSILCAAGNTAGLLGTISYRVSNREIPAPVTTPDAIELQRYFSDMLAGGAKWAVMEVSSHSLVQKRVACTRFEIAAFTNLTRDHLDYHKTMEAYREAKGILFEMLPADGHAVVNADDPAGEYMAGRAKCSVLSWGVGPTRAGVSSQVNVRTWSTSMLGTTMSLETSQGTIDVRSRLVGNHNVRNIACACACGLAAGIHPDIIKQGVETVSTVRGRLEQVDCGQGFSVLVDYAHTDDALANVLQALREMTVGRLIVVFGCGGDRDKGKRPMMGAVAEQWADLIVVTSDNPRSEPPEAIVAEICGGIRDRSRCRVQVDRAEGIREALRIAKSGDTVLVAGKGHEQYQIFKDTVKPFDDRKIVKEFFEGIV